MNKYMLPFLFVLTIFQFSFQVNETNLSIGTDLDKQFQYLLIDQGIVGAAAGYSVQGEIAWQNVGGFADRENKIPFQIETKVRTASIAKSMTAIAAMQLVERGLLDIDLPIQTYIPDYPRQPNRQITVRHLLSHTSGIDGYKNTKEAESQINYPRLSDAVDFFKNRPLLFEPGTQYSYTTYGYTLLGFIIEKISDTSFEAYMQKNIWDLAKMTNTGIDVYGVDEGNSSKLYSRRKRRILKDKTVEGIENNLSNRVPGGGLYTTVDDMLKFGNAVIDNIFIKRETLQLMRKCHSLNSNSQPYGLGWELFSAKPDQGKIIGHGGAQTGCSSQLLIFPEKEIVSVILTNTSRTNVTGFAIDLLKTAKEKL